MIVPSTARDTERFFLFYNINNCSIMVSCNVNVKYVLFSLYIVFMRISKFMFGCLIIQTKTKRSYRCGLKFMGPFINLGIFSQLQVNGDKIPFLKKKTFMAHYKCRKNKK